MALPNNNFLGTVEIMQAVQTFLQTLMLADGVTPVFEDVKLFSTPDLVKAFAELRTFKNRICLIIPGGDEYAENKEGNSMTVSCTRDYILLMCDRDHGNRQAAATGNPDDPKHPGVLVMKDIIENNLIAQNFTFSPRLLRTRPHSGQPFKLQAQDRTDLAGRLGWQMSWLIDAGSRVFSVR